MDFSNFEIQTIIAYTVLLKSVKLSTGALVVSTDMLRRLTNCRIIIIIIIIIILPDPSTSANFVAFVGRPKAKRLS